MNALLGITDKPQLIRNVKVGALWEGFALEEIVKKHELRSNRCYFWSASGQAEIDLFCVIGGKRIGFEFKFADAPIITKSMRIALSDLKLDKLYIIYPGIRRFVLEDKIECSGLEQYLAE